MTTKIYVEIPLTGKDLTLEEAGEFALFIESAMDAYGQEAGKYAGRKIRNVTVYKAADDLVADLKEGK